MLGRAASLPLAEVLVLSVPEGEPVHDLDGGDEAEPDEQAKEAAHVGDKLHHRQPVFQKEMFHVKDLKRSFHSRGRADVLRGHGPVEVEEDRGDVVVERVVGLAGGGGIVLPGFSEEREVRDPNVCWGNSIETW